MAENSCCSHTYEKIIKNYSIIVYKLIYYIIVYKLVNYSIISYSNSPGRTVITEDLK